MSEWDQAARSYEETVEKTTAHFVDSYVDFVRPGPGVRIADIACGPGVYALAMAIRGAHVVAADLSRAMVARLRDRAEFADVADRIGVLVGDAEHLAIRDGAVDAAISNFGVIFCPRVDRALAEMARVTRVGGALMFSAWTSEARNGWTGLLGPGYESDLGFALPRRVIFHWSQADDVVRASVGAGWREVAIETQDAPPTRFESWERVGDVLDSPGTRIAVAGLDDEQRELLRGYLSRRAREIFGDDEVILQREAWLVRGRKGG